MENVRPLTFEWMKKLLSRNPLKAIQTAKTAEASANWLKYEVAAIAIGYARLLKKDMAQQEDFYQEPFWEKRMRARPDKLLLHVFMYLYDSHKGAGYHRASAHAIAVKALYEDESIDVEAIPSYMDGHGGFDGLIDGQEAVGTPIPNGGTEASEPETHSASRPTQRAAKSAHAAAGDKANTPSQEDDDDHEDDDETEDDLVCRPTPKKSQPGDESPSLKLLHRQYIEICIVIQPKCEEDRAEILQAIRDGKPVNVDLKPGKPSPNAELYRGGGNFIPVIIEAYVIG